MEIEKLLLTAIKVHNKIITTSILEEIMGKLLKELTLFNLRKEYNMIDLTNSLRFKYAGENLNVTELKKSDTNKKILKSESKPILKNTVKLNNNDEINREMKRNHTVQGNFKVQDLKIDNNIEKTDYTDLVMRKSPQSLINEYIFKKNKENN